MSPARREVAGVTVECVMGDIVDQPDVDAVVCAANEHLAPGAGVAGAIHRTAGPGLYAECEPLAPIGTGTAVITGGHGLPNPWCIHALGPVYDRSPDPERELASAYRQVLQRAEEHGVRSVATPALSTGVFGYPPPAAARVAMRTILGDAPLLGTVRLFRFVLRGEDDLRVHIEAMEAA